MLNRDSKRGSRGADLLPPVRRARGQASGQRLARVSQPIGAQSSLSSDGWRSGQPVDRFFRSSAPLFPARPLTFGVADFVAVTPRSFPMSVPTTRVLVGLAFGLPALASHSSPSAPSLAPRAAADTAKRAAGLPLQPARYARFTTSQGTWISLDVSPDGQTIVFDLLGDLYTVPITVGKATRLTSGMAFDAQPRFSPDGKRIAFFSDRNGADNIWIMALDGRDPIQVTNGREDLVLSPEWTPDGKYL